MIGGRSKCEVCHKALLPRDLVPIASYIVLGGRCRSCGAAVARFHLWVELAAVIVAVIVVIAESDENRIWVDCALGWTLLAASWIDWEHWILPDALTLPLIIGGLASTAWFDPSGITEAAAGAATGYILFRVIEIGYRLLQGRDGLGQGDAKLMAAAGAWVGLDGLAPVLIGASTLGIIVILIRNQSQYYTKNNMVNSNIIQFGPYISLAVFIVHILHL